MKLCKKFLSALCLLSMLLCLYWCFPLTAEAAGVGSIEGTLRSQLGKAGVDVIQTADGRKAVGFNFNGGPGEQKGLKFQLIDRRVDLSKLTSEEIHDWYQEEKPPKDYHIFLGQADAQGHYRLENVPAGDYFMVVLLPGQRDAGLPSADYRALKEYLPQWDYFEMSVVGIGSCDAFRVTIRSGGETKADYIYGAPFPVRVR
ncbi:MAG: hypothetical protein IJ849_00010 [Selenomonadaceae bacterium]|nr:hypothetical protein [Selenomonadaceae bacterium]